MSTLTRDLHYAGRQLRNSPAFTLAAVLTLALGVGATTAIFSVVYGLLLASLPFHDAARIINIGESHPQVPGSIVATYPDYQDWKTQQKSFTDVAAYSTLNPATVSLATNGHAEQVHRVLASGNLFSLLGVSPLIGRTLSEQDEKPGSDHVAGPERNRVGALFRSRPQRHRPGRRSERRELRYRRSAAARRSLSGGRRCLASTLSAG